MEQAKARQASLREHNLALVARAVFEADEPPSRAGVAAATGLARATVSTLVDRLVAARIVAELPPAAGQVGRPAVPLVPAAGTVVGLGAEVNVDYLGVRALDLTGATVLERIEGGDFHASDPVAVLGHLGDVIRGMATELNARGMTPAGVRLALPGLVDARAGFLQVAPNLGWGSLDPVRLLGPSPALVEIANEANLAGLAQLPFGRFAGAAPSFVYVSGDVGIGAAILRDGELYLGRRGWAGEVGHVAVDPSGPVCRCGARGCLESFAGKDAVLAALGLDPTDDFAVVLDRVRDADPAAREVVARVGTALGTALAAVLNLFDLDTVLLGGIYSGLADDLRPTLEAELRSRVLAAPWERLVVEAAPVADHAALSGGARDVVRDVVQAPSAWAAPSPRDDEGPR
jgi:predicted NBD/HSP70 family sugar kinase